MKPNKACAVVIRELDGETSILAFRHPQAGCQLVKGSIESGESPAAAAERELWEEAGLRARASIDLGTFDTQHEHQVWSIHVCTTESDLPNNWTHGCEDDGGHSFEFFWHPLDAGASNEWHPVFARALDFVRNALASPSLRAGAPTESID